MKYQGSKDRIGCDLAAILQLLINREGFTEYYEPFVGGANVIDKIVCDKRYGSDYNEYLIAFWQKIQQGWNPLIEYPEITRAMYEDVKEHQDKYPKHIVALVGLCASFKGAWFNGYGGGMPTKGGYRDYYVESINNVMQQYHNIVDIEFFHADYKTLHPVNALIYCDPPYIGTRDYMCGINHDEFWDWVREQSVSNYVLVSEYTAPPDFECVWEKQLNSQMQAANTGVKTATERLFSYNLTKEDITL